MNHRIHLYPLLLMVLLFSGCQEETATADLIITNAVIWTGNADQPAA